MAFHLLKISGRTIVKFAGLQIKEGEVTLWIQIVIFYNWLNSSLQEEIFPQTPVSTMIPNKKKMSLIKFL